MTETTKRSVVLRGRSTSIDLEDSFWHELRRIANELGYGSRDELVEAIDKNRRRPDGSVKQRSNAVRHFIFDDVMSRASGSPSPHTAAEPLERLQ